MYKRRTTFLNLFLLCAAYLLTELDMLPAHTEVPTIMKSYDARSFAILSILAWILTPLPLLIELNLACSP